MKFNVIIILAGGITPQGELPENVKRRVEVATVLYKKKRASKMLFSGQWSSYWKHNPPSKSEAELMAEYAQSLGVSFDNILLEEHSNNTFENIFYSVKLFLEPMSWKKVTIVTSDFHVARVKQTVAQICDSSYQVVVLGAPSDTQLLRRFTWHLKELSLLFAQRFLQHFTNRYQ